MIKVLINSRFGRLIVLRGTAKRKHNERIWECLCDCGNIKEVATGHLRDGNTRSCGCLHKEAARRNSVISRVKATEANKKPYGEASFNSLYMNYHRNANKRNLIMDLTKDEFRRLTKQDCFYCGVGPNQVWLRKQTNPKHKTNGEYVYNGIDRMDSNKGYTIDNVVPCCFKCNEAKNSLNVKEFYSYIVKVYTFLKERGSI